MNHVSMSTGYQKISPLRKFSGIPLIYLPIIVMPITIIAAILLKFCANIQKVADIKGYSDFVPSQKSCRYNYKTQILPSQTKRGALWIMRRKLFWIFNCTFYCIYSIALLSWAAYTMEQLARGSRLKPVSVTLIGIVSLTIPFIVLSAWVTRLHLFMTGAGNLKTFQAFLQENGTSTPWLHHMKGLFAWHAYMVKVVENYWCPFYHDKKCTYAEAAVDKSYWHINPKDREKLHPEDRENPLWNKDAAF